MYPNTTDMKNDTETSQFTALQLLLSRKETSLLLENADLFARLYTLTFLKLSLTKLSEMSGNNSCSFDWHSFLYLTFITIDYLNIQLKVFKLFQFIFLKKNKPHIDLSHKNHRIRENREKFGTFEYKIQL